MTFTTPVHVSPDTPIVASVYNAQVADNIADLRSCKTGTMARLATQSVPDGAWQTITWQFSIPETVDMWSPTINPDRIQPPIPGYWWIKARLNWPAGTVGRRACRLLLNGTGDPIDQGTVPAQNWTHDSVASRTMFFNGTSDYLAVQAFQDSGAAINLSVAGTVSYVEVTWQGA